MNDAHPVATADELWQTALRDLQLQMTRATFDNWFRGTQAISLANDALTVRVRDQYAKKWIEHAFQQTVERTVAAIAGRTIEVRYVPNRTAPGHAY